MHGGVEFTEIRRARRPQDRKLHRLAPLAPLHQPHNLLGVRAARRAFPEAAQVACFDTTFHRAHPWVNDTYALPRELYEQGIRHYGAVRGGVRITDHSVNFDSDQCAAK